MDATDNMPIPKKTNSEKKLVLVQVTKARRERFERNHGRLNLKLEYFEKLQEIAREERLTVTEAAAVVIDAYCKKVLDTGRLVNASTQTSSPYPAIPGLRVPMSIESLPFFNSPLVPRCNVRKIQDDGKLQDQDVDSSSAGECSVMSRVKKISNFDAVEPSARIMADKKTSLEVIKSEMKEEPQSSDESYKTYIVKEEDLEDDWTENDAKEVSKEPQSSDTSEKCLVKEEHLKEGQQGEEIQRRFHTDSVQEADSEDGWTEDDAKETEAQQSKEADHQTLTFFIKEEPVDSDIADDDDEGTALQATSPSCSKQGGDSSLQSSYQSKRNSQEMSGDRSCDGARHLPEDFPLQDYLGTHSDSSERKRRTSEYDSYLIPSQVPYFYEKRAADRETPDATTSSHEHGELDRDRNEDITMEYDEMINQSSQLRATGSVHIDPSCSLTKEKPFLCSVCSKGFTLRKKLSRHMKTHGGEKPHECTFCSKRFLYGDGLKRHLRIHTGEKPYQCSVCDKGFHASGNLAQHMTVHSGKKREKRYQCKFCDKKYSRSNGLHEHLRTHTGEKPYQCMYCDVRFTRVNTLSMHIRSHTGEKPYECSFCKKTFSRNSHLLSHIKIHTGEKPFECSVLKL